MAEQVARLGRVEREVEPGTRAPHERPAARPCALAAGGRGRRVPHRLLGRARASRRAAGSSRETPLIPSTKQWWTLVTRLQRPPARPSSERDLPQRPAAVEPVRVEVAHPVEQLGVAAGGGQGRMAHVARDVEMGIGLPARPAQAPVCGWESRLRKRGIASRRRSSSARTSSTDGTFPPGSGSNTIAQPMCMWEQSSACSSSRNAASRGVSCSLVISTKLVRARGRGHPQRLRIRAGPVCAVRRGSGGYFDFAGR